MRCSKCGFENPEGMKFCGWCTYALGLICPNCYFENPAGFKFCGQCTASLGSTTKVAAENQLVRIGEAARDSVIGEGERKTVTALFADIKGSMELMEDLDPEEARYRGSGKTYVQLGRKSDSASRQGDGPIE